MTLGITWVMEKMTTLDITQLSYREMEYHLLELSLLELITEFN